MTTAVQNTYTVRLLERKSNRILAEVNTWQSLIWTKRWRRWGSGSLSLLADNMPASLYAPLFDGNLAVEIFREWYNEADEKVSDSVTGPVDAWDYSTDGDPVLTLRFADALFYTSERMVNTDSAANVDPGNVTAIAYIHSLWNSELFTPSAADRTIDVPATIAGLTGGGSLLDLPVRWPMLSDAVEAACIAGGVGVEAVMNASRTIEFRAKPINDRTTAVNNAVILSARNTGAVLKFTQDSRRVRNRVYVLGANTGASRDVEVRTDSDFATGDRLREMTSDARHLSTQAEYQARGDAILAERSEAQRVVDVTEASREYDIRPGDKVTVREWLRTDSVSPEISVDLLCLARTITARPNQSDSIRLELGGEVPTTGLLLKGIDRRSEPARVV